MFVLHFVCIFVYFYVFLLIYFKFYFPRQVFAILFGKRFWVFLDLSAIFRTWYNFVRVCQTELHSKWHLYTVSRDYLFKLLLNKFFFYFFQNFSCIVGPNGSGKSNVIDSLLFVLGYRAQKIRSKKVSTLIHKSHKYPDLQSCSVQVNFIIIKDEVCILYTNLFYWIFFIINLNSYPLCLCFIAFFNLESYYVLIMCFMNSTYLYNLLTTNPPPKNCYLKIWF